ncbi:MAG: DUF3800 domain-containing protein [Candidatus Omnitrophica bacterium]|nr:MAG: hypothetical protein UZ16_OP3001002078 [Candidatus Hinthialibacteria bacterium OLB16]MCK6497119.1 DUF3800 domain-containing protein [bacterium]MCL4735092.1 DUF3800 domain-containing protein [Candidatus Omnitrophota bacterium]NUP93240.1 DUF3800 domain-containing protein [Candidatus Omnitrophota bacterium]
MTENRPKRFRLYIDESGDHTYNLLDDPSHRYLALLGVWFQQGEDYVEFSDRLESLKRDIFGPRPDKPVILHRSDIINRKGPFGILCNPSIQRKFDKGLLEVIEDAKFKMACVIIDKKKHLDNYSSPFHPYHYCMAAMLERYCGRLKFLNAVGDVLAESRGKEEDLQLRQAYERVFESGTHWFSHEDFQRTLTSKKIKIQPKVANIAGLQLADVLAHPIKQGMLAEKGLVEDAGKTFGEEVREVTMKKWNSRAATQQVDGYGKKWL